MDHVISKDEIVIIKVWWPKNNNHITLEDEKEIDNQKYPINIDSS
jgi:hypothetical protein